MSQESAPFTGQSSAPEYVSGHGAPCTHHSARGHRNLRHRKWFTDRSRPPRTIPHAESTHHERGHSPRRSCNPAHGTSIQPTQCSADERTIWRFTAAVAAGLFRSIVSVHRPVSRSLTCPGKNTTTPLRASLPARTRIRTDQTPWPGGSTPKKRSSPNFYQPHRNPSRSPEGML